VAACWPRVHEGGTRRKGTIAVNYRQLHQRLVHSLTKTPVCENFFNRRLAQRWWKQVRAIANGASGWACEMLTH
jgi:hypothetical protein